MTGRIVIVVVVSSLVSFVVACDGGHRADLSGIPDPFPTYIENVHLEAPPGANFDLDRDGDIGTCDLNHLINALGTDRLGYDLDADGAVAGADAFAWVEANRSLYPPDMPDGEIVDMVRRFTGDELVVYLNPDARGLDEPAVEKMLSRHGVEAKGLHLTSLSPYIMVTTPDRDLETHIDALAGEPVVESISLNHFTTIGCYDEFERKLTE